MFGLPVSIVRLRFFAWAFYSKYASELDEAERTELEDMVKDIGSC